MTARSFLYSYVNVAEINSLLSVLFVFHFYKIITCTSSVQLKYKPKLNLRQCNLRID